MSLHAIHHLKENRPAFYDNVQNNLLEGKQKSAKLEHFNLEEKKLLKKSPCTFIHSKILDF